MLQRIYGTAWNTPDELKDYLWRLEEAKKRDHRKIGHDLDLFSMVDEIGAGLILWHPKGGKIRKLIENFWTEEHEQNGYDFWVHPPYRKNLSYGKRVVFLVFYKENMYSPLDIDGQKYFLKPMNLPLPYPYLQGSLRSYRDLPLRYAEEKAQVYRYERSGVMHGLMRVRGFTQDDATISAVQIKCRLKLIFVLGFSLHILRSFGFKDIQAYLSTNRILIILSAINPNGMQLKKPWKNL
jgi:threonyl-tRNA synthetase